MLRIIDDTISSSLRSLFYFRNYFKRISKEYFFIDDNAISDQSLECYTSHNI